MYKYGHIYIYYTCTYCITQAKRGYNRNEWDVNKIKGCHVSSCFHMFFSLQSSHSVLMYVLLLRPPICHWIHPHGNIQLSLTYLNYLLKPKLNSKEMQQKGHVPLSYRNGGVLKWGHPQIIHVIYGFSMTIHFGVPPVVEPANYGTPKSPLLKPPFGGS